MIVEMKVITDQEPQMVDIQRHTNKKSCLIIVEQTFTFVSFALHGSKRMKF